MWPVSAGFSDAYVAVSIDVLVVLSVRDAGAEIVSVVGGTVF